MLLDGPVVTADNVQVDLHLSWTFCAVLESAKLVSVLTRMFMSQGMLKGLLSPQLQLLMEKAQLLMVVKSLAACNLMAATDKEWLSHSMTPSKV